MKKLKKTEFFAGEGKEEEEGGGNGRFYNLWKTHKKDMHLLGNDVLILATGFENNEDATLTELFTMHPNSGLERCIDFQIDTPFPVHAATGGVLELHHDENSETMPTPVYCGGTNLENFITKDCFRLDQRQPLGAMLTRRLGAASVSTHNGTVLWVTGGLSDSESDHDISSDSTEQLTVSADGQSLTASESIQLPRALSLHCLVLLNKNLALLIGGLGSLSPEGQLQVSDRSWSIDTNSFSLGWTERSSLMNAREKHVCGVIRDISHPKAKEIVMVAGGALHAPSLTATNSVELLEAENNDVSGQWQIGPSLPEALLDASSATTSDQKFLYVVGGQKIDFDISISIYLFYCDDSICEWNRLCTELSVGTYISLAFTLPFMDASGSVVGKNKEASIEVTEEGFCGE